MVIVLISWLVAILVHIELILFHFIRVNDFREERSLIKWLQITQYKFALTLNPVDKNI